MNKEEFEKGFDELEQLGKVSDVVNQEPIKLRVTVDSHTWIERLLIRIGFLPKDVIFKIRPIHLGTLIKISKELIGVDMEIFEKDNLFLSNFKAMEKYGDKMARIVAYAITNNKREPSQKLIDFILDNFSSHDLLKTMQVVIKQMDVINFMISITSIKGVSLTNPMEKIANGQKANGSIPGK